MRSDLTYLPFYSMDLESECRILEFLPKSGNAKCPAIAVIMDKGGELHAVPVDRIRMMEMELTPKKPNPEDSNGVPNE